MGLFDWVENGEFKCPICGTYNSTFQSKDGPCLLYTFDFREMDSFYGICKGCGAWMDIELTPIGKTKFQSLAREAIENLRMTLSKDDYIVTVSMDTLDELDKKDDSHGNSGGEIDKKSTKKIPGRKVKK